MGLSSGFFAGGIVYALILAATGFYAIWLFITLLLAGAIVGTKVACTLDQQYIAFVTSFLGAYLFMRGLTFFFGGFPSEVQMFSMMAYDVDQFLGNAFWVYLAVFVATGILGFVCQTQVFGHDEEESMYTKSEGVCC